MEKSMTKTRTCERCSKDISELHGHCKYCKECAKESKKEYNSKYSKRYDKQFPKSARGKYREYYKFLMTLTQDELSALHIVKKIACKEKNADTSELKAQMKLINESYKRKGVE